MTVLMFLLFFNKIVIFCRRDDQMTRSLERPFQMNVEYHLLLIPSKLHLKGFEYFERVTEKPKL